MYSCGASLHSASRVPGLGLGHRHPLQVDWQRGGGTASDSGAGYAAGRSDKAEKTRGH